jgi:DNA-binding transcriptional MerR regulator
VSSSKTYQPGQDDLTASDVFKLAGLTYRQLHDWENRAGIIESERATSEGWRKFTFEEVIALAICARLREHLAISLEKTGKIYQWLLGQRRSKVQETLAAIAEDTLERMRSNPKVSAIIEGQSHKLKEAISDEAFQYVVKEYIVAEINKTRIRPVHCALKMAQLGLPVYLLTDKEETWILSEQNLVNWVSGRILSKPTLIYPLNEFLNDFLSRVGMPRYTLDTYATSFRDYWDKVHEQADLTRAEREVIRLIRERDYQRVVAHVKGGKVIRVEREEELSASKQGKLEDQIMKAICEGEHQTVSVEKRDGKVVRINRKESIKLDKVTGKT